MVQFPVGNELGTAKKKFFFHIKYDDGIGEIISVLKKIQQLERKTNLPIEYIWHMVGMYIKKNKLFENQKKRRKKIAKMSELVINENCLKEK